MQAIEPEFACCAFAGLRAQRFRKRSGPAHAQITNARADGTI
jgi:hypothetical protein